MTVSVQVDLPWDVEGGGYPYYGKHGWRAALGRIERGIRVLERLAARGRTGGRSWERVRTIVSWHLEDLRRPLRRLPGWE